MKTQHFISKQKGFTLVELLSVIVIIGILAGLVAGGIQFANQKVAREKTKSQIQLLSSALEEYKLDTGSYPLAGATETTSTGTLITNLGYLNSNSSTTPPTKKIYLGSLDTTTKTNEKGKKEFVNNKQGWLNLQDTNAIYDPYGNPYRYLYNNANRNRYRIWSYGKNGIGNYNIQPDPSKKGEEDDI